MPASALVSRGPRSRSAGGQAHRARSRAGGAVDHRGARGARADAAPRAPPPADRARESAGIGAARSALGAPHMRCCARHRPSRPDPLSHFMFRHRLPWRHCEMLPLGPSPYSAADTATAPLASRPRRALAGSRPPGAARLEGGRRAPRRWRGAFDAGRYSGTMLRSRLTFRLSGLCCTAK